MATVTATDNFQNFGEGATPAGQTKTRSIVGVTRTAGSDATLAFTAFGDFDFSTAENVRVQVEGFDLGIFLNNNSGDDLFDLSSDVGNQYISPVTGTAIISRTVWTGIIADGQIDITYTFGAGVDDFSPPEEYLVANFSWNATTTPPASPPSPTANSDSFTVAANSSATSLAVLANDAPARGGDTLSIGSISGFDQSTGTLSIAGGTILYTPAAGYTGTTSFNYTAASSSGGSAGATATIRVLASGTPTTGNDNLTGTDAADTILLLAGNDTYRGGLGNDVAFGNQGDDVLYGNQGADTLYGGQGADSLYGGQDADVQVGNADADVLFGNLGSDALYGGQGNDTLFGGQGDDVLWGDRGDDVLSGDLGADRYVFGQASGNDLILGFNQGEGDRISLQGQTYTVGSASNGNALLTLSGGGTLELAGITATTFGTGAGYFG